jgi:hypothetical protein
MTTPPPSSNLESDRDRRAQMAQIRHDLRSPLNAILGYSEMLLEESDEFSETVQAQLQQIHYQGTQILQQMTRTLSSATAEPTADRPPQKYATHPAGPHSDHLYHAANHSRQPADRPPARSGKNCHRGSPAERRLTHAARSLSASPNPNRSHSRNVDSAATPAGRPADPPPPQRQRCPKPCHQPHSHRG